MTRQTDRMVFWVSGCGYPSVQYGSGAALVGILTYDPDALYYAVTAQLEGPAASRTR